MQGPDVPHIHHLEHAQNAGPSFVLRGGFALLVNPLRFLNWRNIPEIYAHLRDIETQSETRKAKPEPIRPRIWQTKYYQIDPAIGAHGG